MPKSSDDILEELIQLQRKKVHRMAQELGVHLTAEDILNPHDFPVLLQSPRFNFEDGLLSGLLSAQMALRSHFNLDMSSENLKDPF
ncbi:MAG: hypothetical protein JNK65_01035 [Deltaproteobacteria bacterium]|nr:hypothetical protein [Deltaproteobacteria bacterium]